MGPTDTPAECGVGIRGVAAAIDSAVWFVLLFVAADAVAVLTGQLQVTSSGLDAELTGLYGTASFVLWLGLGTAYHTSLESRYGRAVGEQLVKIRVVSDDGSSPSVTTTLVRNALRIVDWLPLLYVVGNTAMVRSDRDRRLGDRVANAVVR